MDAMYDCHCEPRLIDALADPVVRAIMAADHVDANELETTLSEMARRVRAQAG